MGRKVPKGRDRREREASWRKRAREYQEKQAKRQTKRCPRCGKEALDYREHRALMLVKCGDCGMGDSLDKRLVFEEYDYHEQFQDRFRKGICVDPKNWPELEQRKRRVYHTPPPPKVRACINCNFITNERTCPNCGSNSFSDDYSGLVIILDREGSTIAKTLNVARKGKYALKVR